MTENQKRWNACGEHVTLNGQPAAIKGVLCNHATVATLPDGPAFQFAWETVYRVIENGGQFKS